MNFVSCKSTFPIQHLNKKIVCVGYLIDVTISVVILFECNVSNQYLILDHQKWKTLMTENNFKSIFDSLSIKKCKRGKLDNDFFYRTSAKTESVIIFTTNNRITLSRQNLFRIKQLQTCIDANITEKLKKLQKYQSCFNLICQTIKKEVENLPTECIRTDFITSYIDDYNFNVDSESDENKSFILEIQKMNTEKLAEVVVSNIFQESKDT